MEEEKQGKRKTFISEKIVGRELTLRRAARYLLLSAGCGLLFGLCAVLVLSLFAGWKKERTQAEHTAVQEENGPQNPGQPEGAPQDGMQQMDEEQENAETEHLEKENETKADAQQADSNAHGGAAASDETQSAMDAEERTAEIEEIVRREIERHAEKEQNFEETLAYVKEQIRQADAHVVSVRTVRRDTGWFNDPIETEQQAAGIIISIADPEIQILTTEHAVRGADSLSVCFQDGTVQEAGVRQSAEADGVAVLAVPKAGLGSSFLSGISPVKLALSDPREAGEFIIAAGAPLGAAHSADIGAIGYIADGEQTADGVCNAFYADLAADAEKGTFLISMDGELIGMASGAAQEDASRHGVRAMGISYLKKILPHLSDGRAVPYLGVRGRTVSAEMEAEDIPPGVYVTGVDAGSPAYDAGIKNGDIVTAVDGTEVRNITAYEAAVSQLSEGAEARLRVMRGAGNGEYSELEFVMNTGAR